MTDPRGHKLHKRETARCHWPANDRQGTGRPMPSGGVVCCAGTTGFPHQGDKRHRCAGVLWVAVHLRHTAGPKSIAAPKCPGSDTAAIRGSVWTTLMVESTTYQRRKCSRLSTRGVTTRPMVVWAVIHRFSLETSYKHNMPMVEQRLSPEYVDRRGKSWVAPSKAKLAGLEMIRYRYGHEDCEIIVPSFTMESGGKVPKRVRESIDTHLRRKIRQGHTACLQCLNYPTPAETSKM